ncbi:translation initiation factor IF-3 [Salinisphaera sp.]|uniref:translation initiation factor IF-3 n=1 Tax=unclassified Salinisphaera TaxID=2649847 RepID=UPI000C55B991|nr:translation initiation factor IF-3 [Salinisphaera sp.]MBS61617.1 translation initiation factor IF-3 [Salinisphaera sp.]
MASGQKDRRNDAITAREVRVIDPDGEQVGIMRIEDALEKAGEYSLDLVEVSPNANPPVTRIMDYGKHIFEKKKTQQAGKQKQKQTQLKEVKFRPGTDKGDYNIKLRKLKEFLEDGDKIKITLRFRGREMAHQELGMELMNRVRDDLEEMAGVEQHPEMQGRLMTMVMAPLKGVPKNSKK